MKVSVNKDLCVGCGTCVGICPQVFKLEDGKAVLIDGLNYVDYKGEIDQAVISCPVQAIVSEE